MLCKKHVVGSALALLSGFALHLSGYNSYALPSFQSRVPNAGTYSCATCHDLGQGDPSADTVHNFGSDFLNAGLKWTAALAAMDSDGDGFTNGAELGDPAGTWVQGNSNPPGPVFNPSDPTSHPATTTAPSLAIEHQGDQVKITWPGTTTGYKLQDSPEVVMPAWTDVATATNKVNDTFTFITPATGNRRFYRLVRP
jgi:hypothetical protein